MNPITSEIFRQIEPLMYVSKFLESGVRPDGRTGDLRSLIEVRDSVIESSLGSASVRIGNTSVIAAVTGGIFVTPSGIIHSSGNTGKLNVTCDYSLCSLGDRRQAQAIASTYSQPIESILNNEKIFSTKDQLFVDFTRMISEELSRDNKPVWDLTVNLLIVRDDGSVLDCALLAAVQALRNTRLASIDESSMMVDVKSDSYRRLVIGTIPMAFTLVYHKSKWLVDPTKEEENVLPKLHVVVDSNEPGNIFSIYGPELPGGNIGGEIPKFNLADLTDEIIPKIKTVISDRISKLH